MVGDVRKDINCRYSLLQSAQRCTTRQARISLLQGVCSCDSRTILHLDTGVDPNEGPSGSSHRCGVRLVLIFAS